MTDDAKVMDYHATHEKLARKLCQASGQYPDLLVMRGEPMRVCLPNGVGFVAPHADQCVPLWKYFSFLAEAAELERKE